jgi:hypothetical protein
LPSGTSKIGQFEYDVGLNSAPRTVQEINDLPVKAAPNGEFNPHPLDYATEDKAMALRNHAEPR